MTLVSLNLKHWNMLSTHYRFHKPNDSRALQLMNAAAKHVVTSLSDIIIAYGVSDEYSFVLHRSTQLFERRTAKLTSTIVSTFTAAFTFLWTTYMGNDGGGGGEGDQDGKEYIIPQLDLGMLPTFDARAVVYPGVSELRDYLSWRQVDCHINNLYNTTFWNMVQRGDMSTTEAEEALKGTVAADKNEILWSRYGINYNAEPEMFKKGSIVFREYALVEPPPPPPPPPTIAIDTEPGSADSESTAEQEAATAATTATVVDQGAGDQGVTREREREQQPTAASKTQQEKIRKAKQKARVVIEHLDIIRDDFWLRRPWILSGKPGKPVAV